MRSERESEKLEDEGSIPSRPTNCRMLLYVGLRRVMNVPENPYSLVKNFLLGREVWNSGGTLILERIVTYAV